MKKIIFHALFWTMALAYVRVAHAQSYNPSWYNANQPYLKVGTTNDGIYRIYGRDITKAGVALNSIATNTLQLIENGKEIPIWYQGNTTIGNDDFIEFIGKRNTGKDETWAYESKIAQSGDYYSIYSDTTYYWLTWNNKAGLRFNQTSNNTFSNGALQKNFTRNLIHLEQENTFYYGDGDFQIANPLYARAEGFYWTAFINTSNQPVEYPFNITLPAANNRSQDTLYIKVKLNSLNVTSHKIGLKVNINQGSGAIFQELSVAEWQGYGFGELKAAILQSQLPNANQVNIKLVSYNPNNEDRPQVLLDWIDASYIRNTSLSNNFLEISGQKGRSSYTLSGLGTAPTVVYDPENMRRFDLTPSGGTATFSNETTFGLSSMYAFQTNVVKTPIVIKKDIPSDWAATTNGADEIILTTSALKSSAQEMANYRQTKDNFAVKVVDVQDIFDQFDYGRPTPVAIQRFVHQTQHWQKKPQYLLIWGDTLYPSRTRSLQSFDVPSFGRPSSDGWFGMQFDGAQDWKEVVAIGRVTVRSNNEATSIFIPKLKKYEANTTLSDWNKHTLFLAGGHETFEQRTLKTILLEWANTLAKAPFGADTSFFSKTTSKILDASLVDSVQAQAARGVSWLTYFGHSSSFQWEVITKPAEEWQNSPRLPVILSLGCTTGSFAGDFFIDESKPVFAEEMVVLSQNGAIGHWGGSGSSYISYTADLANQVATLLNQTSERRLGKIFQKAKQNYLNNYPNGLNPQNNVFELFHVLEYNLIGDPATSVNLPIKPDYHVEAKDLFISPISPIPADSNLTVNINLHNYGLTPSKTSQITLQHIKPNGQIVSYTQDVAPFELLKPISFKVKINDAAIGKNTIKVVADAANVIDEQNEANNAAEKSITIFSSGVSIVSPTNYGVATQTTPKLRISTTAKPGLSKSFVFELDSTATFTSAFKKTFQTNSANVLVDWQVNTALQNGKTYFWRARVDEANQPANWQTSAFTVRTDLSEGWLQQRTLFADNPENVYLKYDMNKWQFDKFKIEALATSPMVNSIHKGEFIFSGGRELRLTIGIGYLIVDGGTGTLKVAKSGVPTQELIADLNAAAVGDHILMRTRGGPVPVPAEIKLALRNLGSAAIDTVNFSKYAWTFYSHKGFPKDVQEQVQIPTATGPSDLELPVTMYFNVDKGSTLSPVIGPAKSWKTLTWATDVANTDPDRSITFEVLPENGNIPLLSNLKSPVIDLSTIDSQKYPYLQVRATFEDKTGLTTPQVKYWHIGYQAVPELLLAPESYQFSTETPTEGTPINVTVTARNLSQSATGKVRLLYYLTNAKNQTSLVARDSVATIAADGFTTFTKTLSTLNLGGKNQLMVVLDQANVREANTQNNTLIGSFAVSTDKVAPQYQLSIDGLTFPNDPQPVVNVSSATYPFVAAQPTIEIILTDDNTNRPLNDPRLITLKLNDTIIDMTGANITFVAPTASDNRAKIIFKPDFVGKDGTYTLNLSVKDAAGNVATPYQVHFRVQSAVQIESLYPYPNPMITQTTFAFRMRGANTSLVEDLRIRIYTIAGRLVRELDLLQDPSLLQNGALKMDWNKVKWNGLDEFGDTLPTGTYLYKVAFRTNEGAQQANQNPIEKLVIIR